MHALVQGFPLLRRVFDTAGLSPGISPAKNKPKEWLYVICSGTPCQEANGGIDADGRRKQMGVTSKWGQIKIQDDPLFGARNALTKFCSDPFCVVSGASGRPLRTKSPLHRPRGSRHSVCHGQRTRHRPLRGSLCSTQNWGLACERLVQVKYPIFPCFQLRRPDWGAYPWHTLWREYEGVCRLR